ncbi:uncharacterized protein LOC142523893 [Primulina tabacum]|uniref:uncharacterized protein LOC142523892 n=1 Tax=Primulina tabacum TaxID=48773 RepID=UPI003F59A614
MTVFKLLEITIFSAQDLPPVSKMLRTFAVSYVNRDHRLSTAVDHCGNCNPTWNHKVLFDVDERFLKSKSSAITIEIYNVAWLRDLPIGTVHLMINSLSPPLHKNSSLRHVSLQVRRPSGLLKGTMNIGIQFLDSNIPGLSEFCHSGIRNQEKLDCVDQDGERGKEKDHYIIEDLAGPETNPDPQIFPSNSEEPTKIDSASPETNPGPQIFTSTSELAQTQEEETMNMPPEPDNTSIHGSENVRKWLYSNEEYGSSIFENWTETGEKSEEVKLEPKSVKRRLTDEDQIPLRNGKKAGHHKRGSPEGKGLFSCFGNAYGFQFSFICGSKKLKKKMKHHGHKKTQNFTLMSRP